MKYSRISLKQRKSFQPLAAFYNLCPLIREEDSLGIPAEQKEF